MNVHESLKGRTLLAIWKRDLPYLQNSPQHCPEKTFLQLFAEEYVLAPMEPAVASHLHDENLPFVWPDALLTMETRNACSAKAKEIMNDWASRSGVGSPPSLLFKSVEYQLITLFTAKALADSWRASGVGKVRALHHGSLKTNGGWWSGDIPQAVWLDMLGEAYEPLEAHALLAPEFVPFHKKIQNRMQALAKKGERKIRRLTAGFRKRIKDIFLSDKVDYSPVRDSIVVFLNPKYVERDSYIIRQLKKTAPVTVFLIWPQEKRIHEAAEILGVPVFKIFEERGMATSELELYIESFLAYIHDVPTAGNILVEYMRQHHRQAKSFSSWLSRLFSVYRPRLVCSSQVVVTELRYFERICLDMAIPVIGVPHSAIQDPRGVLFAGKDLYVSAMPSKFCEKCYDDALAVRTCSLDGLFSVDEYVMNEKRCVAAGKPTILFLYGTCQFSPGLIYWDGMAERVELLKKLSTPPNACMASYAVYHKLHPLGFDMELFQIAGVDPVSILPLKSNLGDLLKQVDVVVSVNYVSSPSQQAIYNGVSIIHLNTTDSLHFASTLNFAGRVLHNSGAIFAFSVREMWEIAAKIIHDEQYRSDVLARQAAINPLFQPSSSISLPQLAVEAIRQPDTLLRFPMHGICNSDSN